MKKRTPKHATKPATKNVILHVQVPAETVATLLREAAPNQWTLPQIVRIKLATKLGEK